MFLYIIYLFFLLSVIAFSPTRYFSFSLIALISSIPGIAYCLIKKPSKIQTCLFLLFGVTFFAGINNIIQLEEFGRKLSTYELISSSSLWLISYVVMKLALDDKKLEKWGFSYKYFLVFFLLGVYVMIGELIGVAAMDEGSNSVYYILPVLPCIMFYSKNKYYALILTFVLIIFSIKRSAFLIVVASILWLLFCAYKGIIQLNKKSMRAIIGIAVVMIGVLIFGGAYIDAIISRFTGISEDGGSHRDLIWEYAIGLFVGSDDMHQIWGNGPRYFWFSSSDISAAHNDFLEILVSCGIVGEILFVWLHIILIRMLVKLVKARSEMAIVFGICYFTFFIWNLIACQFAYQSQAVCTCMCWAIMEHYINKHETNSLYSH